MPRAPRQVRLRGFLRVNRNVLAISAATVAFTFVPIQDLPASAATVGEEKGTFVAGQVVAPRPVVPVGVSVPATVAETDLARDSYGSQVHTLVQWPLPRDTEVTSPFGKRSAPCGWCSSDHEGVDFGPGAGYPIAAIADGVVVDTGNPSGALGVYAIVEHEIDGVRVRSYYGHMALGTLGVRTGDTIQRGQLLGLVGSTGASTGAHLHFGIETADGEMIDPLPWLRQHANI
jgi:murein DD-endopeptidase MepM/ murein hydrolase activator NlpD